MENETLPRELIKSLDPSQTLPEPELDSQQNTLEPHHVQLQQLSKPGCSKSRDTVLSDAFVSPSQFRQPLKVMPRANIRRRKPCRSLIATDTPYTGEGKYYIAKIGSQEKKIIKEK